MAKFVFKMQQMLNIKRQLEDSVKNELANSIRAFEDEKAALADLATQREEHMADWRQSLQQGMNVQKIRQYNLFMESLESQINNQKKVVNDAQLVVDKVREKLIQAVKERKILESLREKKYEEFKLAEQKKEELALGEVANYKYIERKAGEEDGGH